MRVPLLPALIVALLSSTAALAGGPTVLGFTNNRNIEPVLIKVSVEGKVVDILPAYRLSPELTRLLGENLGEMIHTPALDKSGKPVPTQILMNVALQVDPRSSGDYDAHFVYISATPLPNGRWYWSRDSIGQLSLASPDILSTYPVAQPPPIGGATLSVVGTSGSGGHGGGGKAH
jgi:hypothetical protein